MKLILTAAILALVSTAAFAASSNNYIGAGEIELSVQSTDNAGDNRSAGEGYIYGGFGPYNDSR